MHAVLLAGALSATMLLAAPRPTPEPTPKGPASAYSTPITLSPQAPPPAPGQATAPADTAAPVGPVPDPVSDAAIATQIESLYLVTPGINPVNIRTHVKDGVVTLTGSVEDEVARDVAERTARTVLGVSQVRNEIIVVPPTTSEGDRRTVGERLRDSGISASVRGRLLYHQQFKGMRVGISTVNGVVTLFGVVPSEAHRQKMGEVAKDTRGVERVVNNIVVRPRDVPVDPMAGVGQNISDEWVEGRIKSAIMFNRHVSVSDLDVEVDDGRCILTGTVNSEPQRALAGQIAGDIIGVNQVENDIRIVGDSGAPAPGAAPLLDEADAAAPPIAPAPPVAPAAPAAPAEVVGPPPPVTLEARPLN